jgi:hypothetical protein
MEHDAAATSGNGINILIIFSLLITGFHLHYYG